MGNIFGIQNDTFFHLCQPGEELECWFCLSDDHNLGDCNAEHAGGVKTHACKCNTDLCNEKFTETTESTPKAMTSTSTSKPGKYLTICYVKNKEVIYSLFNIMFVNTHLIKFSGCFTMLPMR